MTQLLGTVQSLLILIAVGTFICCVKNTLNCIRKQREFERAFVNHHKIEVNEQQEEELDPDFFVQLPLELKHANLLKLCRQHKPKDARDVWDGQHSNETYEPSVEVILMRLQRLSKHKRIVKIEAIKCGLKYALIAAEDRFSGYVLKIDDHDRRGVYNIHNKFQRERTSSENIEIHVQEVKADINKAD